MIETTSNESKPAREITLRDLSGKVFNEDQTLGALLRHAETIDYWSNERALMIGFLPERTFFMNQISQCKLPLISRAWFELSGSTAISVNVFVWHVLQ